MARPADELNGRTAVGSASSSNWSGAAVEWWEAQRDVWSSQANLLIGEFRLLMMSIVVSIVGAILAAGLLLAGWTLAMLSIGQALTLWVGSPVVVGGALAGLNLLAGWLVFNRVRATIATLGAQTAERLSPAQQSPQQ